MKRPAAITDLQRFWKPALRIGRCASLIYVLSFTASIQGATAAAPASGLASWYGEELRGKPMANGNKFDPDNLTAASWYYPLGTRVWVTLRSPAFGPQRTAPPSVLVTITDRGPAKRLVRQGRIIDLGQAAFRKLASPDVGLVEVTVHPKPSRSPG